VTSCVLDPVLCGRFVARVFDDVRIGPSPAKIANRLRALGMRPINNVVDVSNYVMLELGQPSHAFDLATVTGGALRVRRAREGETLVTLDEVTRKLHPSDGVICDADDAVISLAGVMGGASTEISDTTSSAIVEMAWWDPPSIAHTSRRHALRSEASGRFERTIDPQIADLAMARFAELMAPDAQLTPGVVDERGQLPEPAKVRLRTSRLNEILGAEITPEMVDGYLEPIGFEVTPAGEDRDVAVPSFRPDTTTEIDVIEEVARHHGYSKIAKTVPTSARAGALTAAQQDRRRVRALMIGRGVTEAMPLPFLAPGDLARAGLDEAGIVVTNPLVSEESVMRSSLRPGLLKAVAYNASHRNHAVSLYELGTTFGAVPVGAALPDEREVLGVVLAGREAPAAAEIWWDLVEHLLVEDASLENASVTGLHATRAAHLFASGTEVGVAGEIAPDVLEAFEITGRAAWIEVDLTVLFGLPHGEHQLEPFSRYPSSDIDLAFVVGEDLPAAALRSPLRAAAGELLAGLELFDVHRSERLGAGLRSLAFRLRFQADDRTLTDDEVAAVRDSCIAAGEAVGARLRD
jgi:phenylalanyl-tRNA synthetase beta chain